MCLAWGLVMMLAAVLYWTLLFFSYQYCPPPLSLLHFVSFLFSVFP